MRDRHPFLLTFILLAAVIAGRSLSADTLILKNGQQLDGQIIAQSRTEIRIAVQGQVRTIQKAEVARVVFANADDPKRQEEARKQEEARRAEEARKADEARKQEEARRAEEARKADETRKADAARKAKETDVEKQKREKEEAARRLIEAAEEAKHFRRYADFNFGLTGGSYRGMHETSADAQERFIRSGGGFQGRGFVYPVERTRDDFGGWDLGGVFVWNRWRAGLEAMTLGQEAPRRTFTTAPYASGSDVYTRVSFGLHEEIVSRESGTFSLAYSFIRGAGMDIYAGGGAMRIQAHADRSGFSLNGDRDGTGTPRGYLTYETNVGSTNRLTGGLVLVGGSLENIAPVPIVFSLRAYQLAGESNFNFEVLQPGEFLRIRTSYRQKYTGWEYSLGTRYPLGDSLFLDVHATVQRATVEADSFEIIDIVVQSYDLTRPPPVSAVEAKLFGIFLNFPFNNDSPYTDRFGTITIGISKRLEFN